MQKVLSTSWGKACLVVGSVFLIVAVTLLCYWAWYAEQPKFQDAVIELGTQEISVDQFLTEHAIAEKCIFVTDTDSIDFSAAGEYEIILAQNGAEETVKLTIKDTVAPVAVFQDLLINVGYIPDASEFVASVDDLAETIISFLRPFPENGDYQDKVVSVVVRDASGNSMTGVCTVSYAWMIESVVLELGEQLTKADVLINPEADEELVDQSQLDTINASGVGAYTITSTAGTKTVTTTVTVQDTKGPELKLQEVKVLVGRSASVEDFVQSVSDPSGDVTLTLLTQLDFKTAGTQTVVVEAKDIHGNITTAETTLFVSNDTVGPKFSGLKNITVEKHSELPDLEKGVKAKDDKDGTVSFTYNASKVNLDKAGTYYITYTAKDKSGNVTTSSRKVTVNPDSEDTAELVASIANSLPNDPEAIRDYVRQTIRYSSNWGGSDPTWFGFTQKHGNCYVHAMALQDILRYKGWSTKMIWVTGPSGYEKSHYWLQIYINGGWKHIDATPSNLHGRYSLMNDAQRYETLVKNGVNRDWDRSLWPVCN